MPQMKCVLGGYLDGMRNKYTSILYQNCDGVLRYYQSLVPEHTLIYHLWTRYVLWE